MKNQATLTIEDTQTVDAQTLMRHLSAELGRQYGDDDGTDAFKAQDMSHPRAAFVVARLEGQPVGCGALRPMPDNRIAEIKRMFIEPTMRGRGIAWQILTKLETIALAFDYQAIWLETGTLQNEAITLYERAGYQRRPCYGRYVDNPYSVCYEKQLKK